MSVASRTRVHERTIRRLPEGAKAAPTPGFIEPSHPTELDIAPSGDEWISEVKFDGYRIQVHANGGRAKVYTRNGLDWTQQFARIAQAALKLPAKNFILDGEAIVQDEHGVADFHALRRSLGKKHGDALLCYAFDLLYLDGHDLR